MTSAREDFLAELLATADLAPETANTSGVSIVPDDERAGSRVASCYAIGEHLVIWCDPADADVVASFRAFRDVPSLDDWAPWGASVGAELLGRGVNRVLTAPLAAPDHGALVHMDRDKPDDVARIVALTEACTEDEIDDAAIEIDDLDPYIWCTQVDDRDTLTAFASALEFDQVAGWWDIGVLTHPDHRRQRLGATCVQALCATLLENDLRPLYRHEVGNDGSAALSSSLGFETANELVALRLTS